MKCYVVISKENVFDNPIQAGKNVLVSFCRKPIWTPFYWLWVQQHPIPNYYDKETAEYALRKYANPKDYEVVEYATVQKEFKAYIKAYQTKTECTI